MKPWEETWKLDPDSLRRVRYVYAGEHTIEISPAGEADRAYEIQKLVEQAPAMARLLLEYSQRLIQDGACPECARPCDAHKPTCELMAVLRDAGVIE